MHSYSIALLMLVASCVSTSSVAFTPNLGTSRSERTSSRILSTQLDDDGIPLRYPVARKKLIQKAREIDPALSRKGKKGSYSSVGWSNRLGTVLTPASIPGVYTACRPFLWNRIDVGCRMTVIELDSSSKDGKPDLFIHSPVMLDAPLMDAIEKLGTVKHVVSPNYEHVKYAKFWADEYPEAFMWGCPGLMEKEPNVRWTGEIPYGCRPLEYPSQPGDAKTQGHSLMWSWEDVQPLHVDCETNPFTGKPFFNEVVFYHTASKTLLTTDTYWNYPKGDGVTNSNYEALAGMDADFIMDWELAPKVEKVPLGSRLWKVGMDKLFRPFYLNLMVENRKQDEFQRLASYMSGLGDSTWKSGTVIPAHGDIIRGPNLVREVLKLHFKL